MMILWHFCVSRQDFKNKIYFLKLVYFPPRPPPAKTIQATKIKSFQIFMASLSVSLMLDTHRLRWTRTAAVGADADNDHRVMGRWLKIDK